MKKIFPILLSLVLLLQTVSSFGLLAGYYLNQKYIAEFLCVNRQKPELKCNGRCYLKKQMEKNNTDDSKLPERKNQQKEVILFLEKTVSASILLPVSPNIHAFHSKEKGTSPLSDIFHPPQYS